jgi:hypothetical protein
MSVKNQKREVRDYLNDIFKAVNDINDLLLYFQKNKWATQIDDYSLKTLMDCRMLFLISMSSFVF